MSKYQQIRVSVEPEYKIDLAHDLPAIFKHLSGVDNRLIEGHQPALIDLVPMLVRLSLSEHADSKARTIVNDYLGELEDLERQIQNCIAGWRLSGAETGLNQMDDLFIRLEQALSEI